jgi:hypothetical protein
MKKIGTLLPAKQADDQSALLTKVFSSQILATFPRIAIELIPRNYYSQTRKDAPVTLVLEEVPFSL